MSNKKHETIADIVAEMKRRKEMLEDAAFAAPLCYLTETMKAQYEILDEFIERFEAAHKREMSKNVSKNRADFGQLGNAAKLCEALENSNGLLEELAAIGEWGESAKGQIAENNAALAAPPRNCDVGTAEEQARRFLKYCVKQDCEKTCPFRDGKNSYECAFGWAQMPCKEGGAK